MHFWIRVNVFLKLNKIRASASIFGHQRNLQLQGRGKTIVELEGRGNLVELVGIWATVKMREPEDKVEPIGQRAKVNSRFWMPKAET